jgi:hypothetical protein
MFVTSDGHAYARFRRALDRRNAPAALAAAAELNAVGLADALELTLLLHGDRRFERASVRWTARYATDYDLDLVETHAVLALFATLRGGRRAAAARALAEILDRRGLERCAETLMRWSAETARATDPTQAPPRERV